MPPIQAELRKPPAEPLDLFPRKRFQEVYRGE